LIVLFFFPFVVLLPAVTTIVTLVMLVLAGELRPRATGLTLVIFASAAYAQFFSGSPLLAAAGIGVQALLAVALIVRWRLSA
jgi:hypothetical protein